MSVAQPRPYPSTVTISPTVTSSDRIQSIASP